MKAPLFSVIIPAYNRPSSLARAIESVLVQSHEDWELLVVDDGSEPALAPLLSTDHPDPRIRWLRQENTGPAAARKHGAEQATGRYLCLLDDDDYFLPDHLATAADYLADTDYPAAVLRLPLAGHYPDNRRLTYPNYDQRTDALLQYWKAPCGLTSLVFPAAVFQRCPIDPTARIIEDFEWLSRVFTHFPLRQLGGPATVVYVQHAHNRSLTTTDPRWLEERLSIVRQAYREPGVAQRVPRRIYRRLLFHQSGHFARQLALAGFTKRGWRLLGRALPLAGLSSVWELLSTGYTLLRHSIRQL